MSEWVRVCTWLAAMSGSVCVGVGMVAAQVRSEERPETGYWSQGTPRFFVSSKSELGLPYAKPYLSAGYGQPHWVWAGVDLNAILTPEVFEVYTGLRLASPLFDIAYGIRDNWSFNKPLLAPATSYRREDVVNGSGPRAHYLAHEADVIGVVPLPYGLLAINAVMVSVLQMPRDKMLYEESYRVITKSARFYALRALLAARFMPESSVVLGILGEYLFGTGRGRSVMRSGPVLLMRVTDHLQLNLGVSLKVSSPDELGLTLGAYAVAGLRYMWATGEARPALPWEGEVLPLLESR